MINRFVDNYEWLSNFYPVNVEIDGVIYKSVEHAYMSAKSNDESWKKFCQITDSPGLVKKKSYELIKLGLMIDNWDKKKNLVMYDLLLQKFNQEPFKTLLKETGDQQIIEGNYHKDTYWGVCLKTNIGENILGKMIMKIRKKI